MKPDFSTYREMDSWYDHALIWSQYGYCHPRTSPPDWYTPAFVQQAHDFSHSLVEPDIRLWYTLDDHGGKWATYDVANRLLYFKNAVGGCTSNDSARRYIETRHAEHKLLFGGVLHALIMYARTGRASLPDWNTNRSDSFGYRDGKKIPVPRTREIV